MLEKPNKMVPALVGGVILGILSSIPFVNLANCCLCLWVLIGGAVAAKMLISRSPVYPVQSGDGAIVGLLAGVVGSLVYLVIGLPLSLLFSQAGTSTALEWLRGLSQDPAVREQIDEAMRRSAQRGSLGQNVLQGLLSWIICSVIAIGFAALGGLIGVALFEKRKGGPPQGYPPPPQGYPPPPPGYPPQPPPGGPYGGGGAPYGGGGTP
jgi:hypothetical protein